jgi:hypothetical protein
VRDRAHDAVEGDGVNLTRGAEDFYERPGAADDAAAADSRSSDRRSPGSFTFSMYAPVAGAPLDQLGEQGGQGAMQLIGIHIDCRHG